MKATGCIVTGLIVCTLTLQALAQSATTQASQPASQPVEYSYCGQKVSEAWVKEQFQKYQKNIRKMRGRLVLVDATVFPKVLKTTVTPANWKGIEPRAYYTISDVSVVDVMREGEELFRILVDIKGYGKAVLAGETSDFKKGDKVPDGIFYVSGRSDAFDSAGNVPELIPLHEVTFADFATCIRTYRFAIGRKEIGARDADKLHYSEYQTEYGKHTQYFRYTYLQPPPASKPAK